MDTGEENDQVPVIIKPYGKPTEPEYETKSVITQVTVVRASYMASSHSPLRQTSMQCVKSIKDKMQKHMGLGMQQRLYRVVNATF